MEQTPRINMPLLEKFTGRTVRLVGKVMQLRGDTAVLESNGPVTVQLDRTSHFAANHFVEIVGKVNPDLTIKCFTSSDWGTDIDMTIVDAVVDVTHRYKELFYD